MATVCLCLTPSTAFAIPSPELIIGSAASLSQLGALLAASFGGGAALIGARGQRDGRVVAWLVAGLLLLVGGLTFALASMWTTHSAERQARLEATLLRPARQPGQDIADPSLKELSFQEQERHPLGVATAVAASDIDRGVTDTSLVVVDARNEVETEMGGIAAASIVRLKDFTAEDPALQGKRFIFYCHNGNRSYEACEAARAKGIDCRFIIGGLEKWVVEQRPLHGLQARSLAELRAIPDYPGRGRLLDTSDVKSLIETRRPHIIDVRYPGDFARGHMPGALNLPLRRMQRSDVDAQLAALDKTRPALLPCYDRRSCFFADVMGLNLSRAGFEVAGRYTLPFEYFVPSPRPPHVEAWIAQQSTSYWQRTRDALAHGLSASASGIGLVLTLLLLALTSRVAVWPFTAKSERDQIVARETRGEVAELKRQLADDPVRLRRALAAHARRHNLTPLRNLGGLLFLPLLGLATLAAGDAAALAPTSWFWIGDLAKPDPSVGLPLLVAVSLTLYCVVVFANTHRRQIMTASLGIPLLTLLTAPLPAAASLYILFSTVLLVLQRFVVAGLPQRLIAAIRGLHSDIDERRLSGAQRLTAPLSASTIGNKAARLATLAAEGYPVPAALVLDHKAVATLLARPTPERHRRTNRLAKTLGSDRFAVRSSGAHEDGAAQSYAGVYESELGITRAMLPDAIARVAASFQAERVHAYAQSAQAGDFAIIVQRMIEPSFAGVLFTRAPDAPGQMLVEMVEGTGDALASGRATPTTHRFGRITHEPIGAAPAIDLMPLITLGQRIANRFGAPQDIEWAVSNGQFYILQARDIVADPATRAADAHTEHLITGSLARHVTAAHASVKLRGDTPLFRASLMAELLPRPTTLSLDVVNALWGPGGSVDHAARRLGLAYDAAEHGPPQFVRINGRLVADAAVEAQRALRLTARDKRRLLTSAAAISEAVSAALMRARADADLTAALDLQRLTFADLMAHWQSQLDRFLREVHPQAESINILAGLSVNGAEHSLHPAVRPAWHNALVAAALLPERERIDAWRRIAGHRSNLDYELAHPRWSEVPGAVDAFAITVRARGALPQPLAGTLDALTQLKEDAKHDMLRAFANLRRTLLEIDRRVGLGGHIFELTLQEVSSLTPERGTGVQVVARERRHTLQHLLTEPPPPPTVTARDLERLGTEAFATFKPATAPLTTEADLRCKGRGTRVSGRSDTFGRVFVATAAEAEAGLPLEGFRDHDILVTPLVHPNWLAVVLRSSGVIADTGGWLSHMAIVAREHGIAMIVGVPNAGQFRTGDRVRLAADGRVLADAEAGTKLTLVAAT